MSDPVEVRVDTSVKNPKQAAKNGHDAELEKLRRERDEAWELEEARRREEQIQNRVQSNWRNRWL